MSQRRSSSGSVKQSKRQRGPRQNSPGFQRRVDRHHGGPPVHIVARQQLDMAKRLDRKRQAAEAMATALAPQSPILVPAALVRREATERQTSSTSVPRVPRRGDTRGEAQSWNELEATPRVQPIGLRRLAASLLMIPMVGGMVALVTPASAPAPSITTPVRVADIPLRSLRGIDQRIVDMTPPVSLSQRAPAWPGSIQFAALRLPVGPPDVPPLITAVPAPLQPDVVASVPPPVLAAPTEVAIKPVDAPPVPSLDQAELQCRPQPIQNAAIETPPRDAMGRALAEAALKQTTQFVVYNARYTRIAYPGGDVSALEGVCTDVVIRAYRALGIDLQQIVHESRVGSGDTSIDHRRTETLRKFLAIHGESLPITDFIESYQPGDIVTYYRPQNRTSTAHIAIVSSVIAPSGRPMIIHNRGLGVQLEDALFVDKITGHYRYDGPVVKPTAIAVHGTQTNALSTRAPMPLRATTKPTGATKVALRAQTLAINPRP